MYTSISSNIDTSNGLTLDIINKWNNVISKHLTDTDNIISRDIDANIADKYKGDLYGLLVNELRILAQYTYPNIILNGCTDSGSYNGKITTIKLFNTTLLQNYASQF